MPLWGFSGSDPRSAREYLMPSTKLANTGDDCGQTRQSKGRIPVGDRATVSWPRRGCGIGVDEGTRRKLLTVQRYVGFSLPHEFAMVVGSRDPAQYPAQPTQPTVHRFSVRTRAWVGQRAAKPIIISSPFFSLKNCQSLTYPISTSYFRGYWCHSLGIKLRKQLEIEQVENIKFSPLMAFHGLLSHCF